LLHKTAVQKQIELRIGEPLEEYIATLRCNGKKLAEIGDDLGVSESCISRWIKRWRDY